jgi:hypothetical protein
VAVNVRRRRHLIHSALTGDAGDALDVPVAFPFRGHVLGDGERVAFDVRLAVVDDSLPVADATFTIVCLPAQTCFHDHRTSRIPPGRQGAGAPLPSIDAADALAPYRAVSRATTLGQIAADIGWLALARPGHTPMLC